MKYSWAVTLVATLLILFRSLAVSPTASRYLGWSVFGFVFAVIPYMIYKSLPDSKLRLIITFASPLIIGPSLGYWIGFWEHQNLQTHGITTKAIVTSVWYKVTRYEKTPLFKAEFQTPSGTYETSSLNNINGLHQGDTISIRYASNDPNICRVLGNKH